MQYRKLGNTGLTVSEICLGTMTYGNQVAEADAINLIDRAVDTGVNFVDTAEGYGEGGSELVVGKALKQKRHDIILSTKVGMTWSESPKLNETGLSRKHIMDAIDNSLRRLATDYIDIYYAHAPDYKTPIEETLRALDDLVHQGKVRYIAYSNMRAWQLCDALWMSEHHNLARFACIQSPYNLLTRDIEYEIISLCAYKGVGLCVYNPLAGGLLSGKHDPSKPPTGGRFTHWHLGKDYYPRYWSDVNFKAVEQLKEIAQKGNRSLPQFALAWILQNKNITSVLCGSNTIKQLEENLRATEVKISEEELKACDDIWHQLSPPRFLYGR